MSYIFSSSTIEQKVASSLVITLVFFGLAIVGVAIIATRDFLESIGHRIGSFFSNKKQQKN